MVIMRLSATQPMAGVSEAAATQCAGGGSEQNLLLHSLRGILAPRQSTHYLFSNRFSDKFAALKQDLADKIRKLKILSLRSITERQNL